MMVIVAHISFIQKFLYPPFYQSWSGVDLFFVISGFVVSNSLFRILPKLSTVSSVFDRFNLSKNALVLFYLKRMFRILPLAILWIVIPPFLSLYFNHSGAAPQITRYQAYTEIFTALSFQYNYACIYNAIPCLAGYYWSLSVEEHFYFILPLFLIFIKKDSTRFAWALAIVVAILFVSRPLIPFHGRPESLWQWYRYASHNRFDTLFAGVCLALLHHHRKRSEPKFSKAPKIYGIVLASLLIVLLALFPGAFLMEFPQHLLLTAQCFLSTFIVFLASQERGYIFPFPIVKDLLEQIGLRSYGIYLIHVPAQWIALETMYRMNWNWPPLLQLAFWLATLGLLVELSHRLIERPLMAYGRSKLKS
mgnify:FL=1